MRARLSILLRFNILAAGIRTKALGFLPIIPARPRALAPPFIGIQHGSTLAFWPSVCS